MQLEDGSPLKSLSAEKPLKKIKKNKSNFLSLFLKLKTSLDNPLNTLAINETVQGVQYYNKKDLVNKKFIETFFFDGIFKPSISSLHFFQESTLPFLNKIIDEKKDCLFFAFGNTNSGKTFTIIGEDKFEGVLPLSVKYLLEIKDFHNFDIFFSAFEIYNEKIYDLLTLSQNGDLVALDSMNKFSTLKLFEMIENQKISSLEKFHEFLLSSQKRKQIGQNLINNKSSRSHCIYKIEVHFKSLKKPTYLYIIDLAGVERNKATFCDSISTKQLKESKNINLSLSTLLRCFKALKQNEFLPYRESILTKVIFENLVKDMQISFIINFDPNHIYFEDNIRVLEFSALAKDIQPNVLRTNVSFNELKERRKIYENNKSFFGKNKSVDKKNRENQKTILKEYFDNCNLMMKKKKFEHDFRRVKMIGSFFQKQSKFDIENIKINNKNYLKQFQDFEDISNFKNYKNYYDKDFEYSIEGINNFYENVFNKKESKINLFDQEEKENNNIPKNWVFSIIEKGRNLNEKEENSFSEINIDKNEILKRNLFNTPPKNDEAQISQPFENNLNSNKFFSEQKFSNLNEKSPMMKKEANSLMNNFSQGMPLNNSFFKKETSYLNNIKNIDYSFDIIPYNKDKEFCSKTEIKKDQKQNNPFLIHLNGYRNKNSCDLNFDKKIKFYSNKDKINHDDNIFENKENSHTFEKEINNINFEKDKNKFNYGYLENNNNCSNDENNINNENQGNNPNLVNLGNNINNENLVNIKDDIDESKKNSIQRKSEISYYSEKSDDSDEDNQSVEKFDFNHILKSFNKLSVKNADNGIIAKDNYDIRTFYSKKLENEDILKNEAYLNENEKQFINNEINIENDKENDILKNKDSEINDLKKKKNYEKNENNFAKKKNNNEKNENISKIKNQVDENVFEKKNNNKKKITNKKKKKILDENKNLINAKSSNVKKDKKKNKNKSKKDKEEIKKKNKDKSKDVDNIQELLKIISKKTNILDF